MNKLQIEVNDISGSVKFNDVDVPGVQSFKVKTVGHDCSMVTLKVYVKDCDLRYRPKPESVEISEPDDR